MAYLYPSFSFYANKWGSHDLKTGFEYYPFLRNETRRDITPLARGRTASTCWRPTTPTS